MAGHGTGKVGLADRHVDIYAYSRQAKTKLRLTLGHDGGRLSTCVLMISPSSLSPSLGNLQTTVDCWYPILAVGEDLSLLMDAR